LQKCDSRKKIMTLLFYNKPTYDARAWKELAVNLF